VKLKAYLKFIMFGFLESGWFGKESTACQEVISRVEWWWARTFWNASLSTKQFSSETIVWNQSYYLGCLACGEWLPKRTGSTELVTNPMLCGYGRLRPPWREPSRVDVRDEAHVPEIPSHVHLPRFDDRKMTEDSEKDYWCRSLPHSRKSSLG